MSERKLRDASRSGSTRRDRFMQAEADALLANARRAELFEHSTNRGNEAEDAIRRWLRAWLEPQYTITSGEVIDSVEPAGVPIARQQDGIVHANTLDARRYTLPSGMRLVPIEALVATVEVKLRLTSDEFTRADDAAAELLTRQLSLCWNTRGEDGARTVDPWHGDPELKALSQQDIRGRVTFALFGYFGPSDVDTIAGWLRSSKALELVCCLDTGCVLRWEDTWHQRGKVCSIGARDSALGMFVDVLLGQVADYEESARDWTANPSAYRGAFERRIYDDGMAPP